jgi:ABC-type molybdate transport system permease subunit
MVSVVDIAGLLVIVGLNTAIAALATRFFRVRLNTRWGSAVYAVVLTPLPLVATTILLGSVLGPNLGSANTVVALTVLVPLALGIAFDFFWMPAPDDVTVPDNRRQRT